jgi:hypothetical protein
VNAIAAARNALVYGLITLAAAAHARPATGLLPPIVFVSRAAPTGDAAGQVPGLGPHGTFAGAGGRLLEREPDGTVRELVPAGRLFDVADPAVSADGEHVAFAARERADSPWRVWTVARRRAAGTDPLRCRTCDDAVGDDADPAWWTDTLLFVSTRRSPGDTGSGRALYDGTPVTQLWAAFQDGRHARVTHEPNGVLDPVEDPESGRVVFSRWWFNPWRADPDSGLSRGSSGAADSVNLWQVVSARLVAGVDDALSLSDMRLAAGGTVPRRSGMGVQPAPLARLGMLAVAAHNTGLAPRPGTLAVVRYAGPPSPGRRLAGAAIGDEASDPYTESANLRAPAACAPAALADGRVLCALDPGGHGDFGIWLLDSKGGSPTMLVDLPGTWELDPAPVVIANAAREEKRPAKREVPRQVISQVGVLPLFRYLDLDVYMGHGAVPRRDDARLAVYRLREDDSVELIRTVPVPRNGRVDVRLPADLPLFEVLTDGDGRALMSAHGPAQVRGFNSGAASSTSRCNGCHLGHSAKP